MSGAVTRRQARECVAAMREASFVPTTIINLGVGFAPEQAIWEREFPNATRVGIDARRKPRLKPHLWTGDYIKASIGYPEGAPAEYCSIRRSMKCRDYPACNGRHFKGTTMTTLDTLLIGKYAGPFFLWMDIEGSEPEALQGATEVLKQTRFICIEMGSVWEVPDHVAQCERLLAAAGFKQIAVLNAINNLYARIR